VTPVIFCNLNLPPEERYLIKNILCSLIIPGPKKPKKLDSFLRPLVDELLMLDIDSVIKTTDGEDGSEFILRAWVVVVTGTFNPLSKCPPY
jgi:Transposase family tnp2